MSGKPTGGKWVVVTSRDVHPCVVSNGVAVICMDVENPADAEFIAEAGTVYHETGMGPRELAEKVANLESRVLAIANGCTDYGGGYHDNAEREIFHHGIQTVVNALTASFKTPNELQVRMLELIGSSWSCGCGHTNGNNLPTCACCNRKPGEQQ